MKKFIAYYRVSTDSQGESGLGLEAQRQDVERYIESDKKRNGNSSILFKEFTDIQSGKKYLNREGLNNAIQTCRYLNSKGDNTILLIAKLDRLSRNVAFISALRESGIQFICCDMPDANNFTINIFASVAEHEAEMISSRTKAALQIKKQIAEKDGFINRHGVLKRKLGTSENFTNEGRELGRMVLKNESLNHPDNIKARNYALLIKNTKYKDENGNMKYPTHSQVANKLNNDGFRTPSGSQFSPVHITRLFRQIKEVVGFGV